MMSTVILRQSLIPFDPGVAWECFAMTMAYPVLRKYSSDSGTQMCKRGIAGNLTVSPPHPEEFKSSPGVSNAKMIFFFFTHLASHKIN